MNRKAVAAAQINDGVAGEIIDRKVRKKIKARQAVHVDQVFTLGEIRNDIVFIDVFKLENVIASVTRQRVVAFLTDQDVITGAAPQVVPPRAADQRVVAVAAEEQIARAAAVERVIAIAAIKLVGAAAAGQVIVALAA